MTSREIREMVRGGQRFELPCVHLYLRASSGWPRVACIVGKKVHRSAVVRHRYQRLLREAARAVVASGIQYDMVIVAKPEITATQTLHELKHALESFFKNIT